MVHDLIIAFLVAVIVLAVPGYAWSCLLFSASDWADRSASTIAAACTLVPVIALVLTRVFGTGITLGVAVTAVVLATISGVAALRIWGPAPRYEPVVSLQPPTLTNLVLVLIAIASSLMLVSLTRVLPSRLLFPFILTFVLGAGVTYLVNVMRRWHKVSQAPVQPAPSLEVPKDGSVTQTACNLSLLVVLVLVIVRGYLGPILHDWPYLRGQDQYAHTVMVNLALSGDRQSSYMVYPPGFHTLSAVLSRISDLDPLTLFAALAPALMVLPTLGSYAITRRLFAKEYAVASAFFTGLLLTSPWFFVRDGTYVDLIAAEFLLVLTLAVLMELLVRPSVRNIVLVAVLGSSVVLYHSVAAIYLGLMLALISILILPYLLFRDRHRGVALFLSFLLLTVASLAYTWDSYDVLGTVNELLGNGEGSATAGHATIAIGTQAPHSFEFLPTVLTEPVFWFGLLGLLVFIASMVRAPIQCFMAASLLPAWALIFFVASQTSLSGFPIRFTRDLGIPLSVLAALVFMTVLRSVSRSRPMTVLALLLVASVVVFQLQHSLAVSARRSTQLFMLPTYSAAGKWLRDHNKGGSIIVSPHLNQVPGNAMLAMGDYSTLQSFTAQQLRNPRVVPPNHRQEVGDSLWVLSHPKGERTRRILESYDVRYIVFYKRFRPRSLWAKKVRYRPASFRREPALYQVAYENPDVVIYTVRVQ